MPSPVWTTPKKLGEGCLVACPQGAPEGLPILYLLHGQFDTQEDWWSAKAQLGGILAGTEACPMVIVMPFGGLASREEPPLEEFERRFAQVSTDADATFKPDKQRQGILGISMGAKQALATFLKREKDALSVLGLMSGKFQGDNLDQVKGHVGDRWQPAIVSKSSLYFHYCGNGAAVPRENDKPLTGDDHFFAGNQQVYAELATGSSSSRVLRTRGDGLHNWFYWRPELAEFLRQVTALWA